MSERLGDEIPRCEICGHWAAVWAGLDLLSGHNPNCPHNHKAIREKATGLIEQLVSGIETWAADEDGVPEHLWDAFCLAREVLGRPVKDAEASR